MVSYKWTIFAGPFTDKPENDVQWGSAIMDLAAPVAPPTASPGEPDFIRRLPHGVEYTHVKTIIFNLPSWLTTLTWMVDPNEDPIWAAFRGKTFRTLDGLLQKRERACRTLPNAMASEERQRLIGLRHQFVVQFSAEINNPDRKGIKNKKWMTGRFVDPSRLDERFRPPGLVRPAIYLDVWQPPYRQPKLVERRVISSGPAPWGDPAVPWVDPDQLNQAWSEMFRRHFRDLMRRRRVRHGWRSRRVPVGWPLITQHAVPVLYDYLRPFYPARRYRHGRQYLSAGHYPARLRRDITDILRYELPHLARELTVARVTAAIERYVRKAPARRPQGLDMFRLYPRTGKKR